MGNKFLFFCSVGPVGIMSNLASLAEDNGEAFSITADNYESHNRKHPCASIREDKQWGERGTGNGGLAVAQVEAGPPKPGGGLD